MDFDDRDIERIRSSFQGGERDGATLRQRDIERVLSDALQTMLYSNVRQPEQLKAVDRSYDSNATFWKDALLDKHFASAYIVLDDFILMEWLPFSPGRYYTHRAAEARDIATHFVSPERDEYLPFGKGSMIQGGIGAIRLAEKTINDNIIHFLGATSTGIAHQGIPIALPSHEYRKVMSRIKEQGGCRAKITGSLQSLTEYMPALNYGVDVPRYCFFVEEIILKEKFDQKSLLTTVAVMFTPNEIVHEVSRPDDYSKVHTLDKSWTFYSFRPGSSSRDVHTAAEWMMDYAFRYSHGAASILTDFDENYRLFRCPIEFPLSDILRGDIDWETLRVYGRHFPKINIERYTHVAGNQFNTEIHAEGDVIGTHVGDKSNSEFDKQTTADSSSEERKPNSSMARDHQATAMPLLMSVVYIFGLLSLSSIIGGIYAIYRNVQSSTEFSLLGAKVSTGSVGVAFVAIGLVIGFYTVKSVLRNQYDLASLQTERERRNE